MEIKKFEAYKYRGPSLDKMTRSKFIEELSDVFMDQYIVGYKIGGCTYFSNDEVL